MASIEVLARIERRYRLPAGYFKAKFPHQTRSSSGYILDEIGSAERRRLAWHLERIAREGRKFGLGLVLSSQRPSELSPTVLAQCNTFILHRIVNDADQNLVARLVPDNVGGLLRELPSLPSRQAVLLGWAAPIPVFVEVEELPEHHRPQSADPDFWDIWTRANQRSVTWTEIVRKWTSVPTKGGAEPRIRPT